MRLHRFKHQTDPKDIIQIDVEHTDLKRLQNEYWIKGSDMIENGGILCGKVDHNQAIVTDVKWVPSFNPAPDHYTFSGGAIEHADIICGNDDVIGTIHTHPPLASNLPSDVDINTSEHIRLPGCVLQNKMKCYNGKKQVHVKIKKDQF